jgi:hypothetical protein
MLRSAQIWADVVTAMNAPPRMGIPLRPDPLARRDAAVASLVRAVLSIALSKLDRTARPSEIARRWDDRTVDLVLRAAVSPTSVAGTPALAQVAVAFLDALVPVSAGADLLARGVQLNFAGAAQIKVPGIAIPVADFLGEMAPIPVQTAPTSAGPTLTACKLAVITSLTGEMLRDPNAETLVRQVLIESVGPGLDRVLFSATAATADRPAGLLNGIAALTPAAAGEKDQAMDDDLVKLGAPLMRVAGSSLVYIAAPEQALAMMLRSSRDVPDAVVLASAALTAGTVIAVAANAVVSAVEGAPQIDASREAEFVRDSAPGEIVTSGGVVGTSVGSMFQTDQVALRLRWPISWAIRSPSGLAWMSGVTW